MQWLLDWCRATFFVYRKARQLLSFTDMTGSIFFFLSACQRHFWVANTASLQFILEQEKKTKLDSGKEFCSSCPWYLMCSLENIKYCIGRNVAFTGFNFLNIYNMWLFVFFVLFLFFFSFYTILNHVVGGSKEEKCKYGYLNFFEVNSGSNIL